MVGEPSQGWVRRSRGTLRNLVNRLSIVRLGCNLRPRAAALTLAGALLVAACGTPAPTPTPSASPSPATSASPAESEGPSAAASPAVCASPDITATGGPWGGAAGSRGSDVAVVNRGSAACLLPAGPTIALVDQAGTVLLANTPPKVGAGPAIEPGGTIGFSLVIGNWCNQQVSLPLHFSLALAGDAVDIGALMVATIDDLPPCNGPGQPASLSATDWEAR